MAKLLLAFVLSGIFWDQKSISVEPVGERQRLVLYRCGRVVDYSPENVHFFRQEKIYSSALGQKPMRPVWKLFPYVTECYPSIKLLRDRTSPWPVWWPLGLEPRTKGFRGLPRLPPKEITYSKYILPIRWPYKKCQGVALKYFREIWAYMFCRLHAMGE